MATSASKSSLSAMALSATAMSGAPGAVTCVIWRSATPSAANSRRQASAIFSVSAVLKRARTMPITSPLPSRLAACPLSAACMNALLIAVGHEAGHFEAMADHAGHPARTAEHAQAYDAEVAQDLCADAVSA